MAYRTISVDIEIDCIDSDDLIDEFITRWDTKGCTGFTDKQRRQILIDMNDAAGLPITSINDRMKIDFLKTIWDRISPQQLEEKLTA